jgi:hypothetical protein
MVPLTFELVHIKKQISHLMKIFMQRLKELLEKRVILFFLILTYGMQQDLTKPT